MKLCPLGREIKRKYVTLQPKRLNFYNEQKGKYINSHDDFRFRW